MPREKEKIKGKKEILKKSESTDELAHRLEKSLKLASDDEDDIKKDEKFIPDITFKAKKGSHDRKVFYELSAADPSLSPNRRNYDKDDKFFSKNNPSTDIDLTVNANLSVEHLTTLKVNINNEDNLHSVHSHNPQSTNVSLSHHTNNPHNAIVAQSYPITYHQEPTDTSPPLSTSSSSHSPSPSPSASPVCSAVSSKTGKSKQNNENLVKSNPTIKEILRTFTYNEISEFADKFLENRLEKNPRMVNPVIFKENPLEFYHDTPANIKQAFKDYEADLSQIAPNTNFLYWLIFKTIMADIQIHRVILVTPCYLPPPYPSQVNTISILSSLSVLDTVWRLLKPPDVDEFNHWLTSSGSLNQNVLGAPLHPNDKANLSYSPLSFGQAPTVNEGGPLQMFGKTKRKSPLKDQALKKRYNDLPPEKFPYITVNFYDGSLTEKDSRLACYDLLVILSMPFSQKESITYNIFTYYTPKYVLIGASSDTSWEKSKWDQWVNFILSRYPYQYFAKGEKIGLFKIRYGAAKPPPSEIFEWSISFTVVSKKKSE